MIEHHIQRQILRRLQLGHSHFADLVPAAVESNLFNYHLKQLMAHKYVEKAVDNSYHLTAMGVAEGIHLMETLQQRAADAHSILLLTVRRADGAWLLRRRLVQPNRGLVGVVHGEPVAGEPVTATAQKRLLQKTGLTATFTVRAGGIITIYQGDMLESFSHAVLLVADDPTGNLSEQDETGENFWASRPDFSADDYLPSMSMLAALASGEDQRTVFDETYYL